MQTTSTASEWPWEEEQRAARARKNLEFRELLRNFALVIALIVLTLAFAIILAR